MKMRKFRKVYEVMVLNEDYTDIDVRRFARNRKTAEKIVRQYKNAEIFYLSKRFYVYLNPDEVEG